MREMFMVALVSSVCVACTADVDDGSDTVSFSRNVQPLFDRACNCHQSTPLMAPFSLAADVAYTNLVGKPSSELPTMQLVAAGKLNESYLWHKVNGTQLEVGGSGKIMPYTLPFVPDHPDELRLIERWIAGGAKP
jgi:hypothetical protein